MRQASSSVAMRRSCPTPHLCRTRSGRSPDRSVSTLVRGSSLSMAATLPALPPLTDDVEKAKGDLRSSASPASPTPSQPTMSPRCAAARPSRRAAEARGRRGVLRRGRGANQRVWNLPSKGEVFRGLLRHPGRAHVRPARAGGRLLPVQPHGQHRRAGRGGDGAALGPGLRARDGRQAAGDERDVDARRVHRGQRRHALVPGSIAGPRRAAA